MLPAVRHLTVTLSSRELRRFRLVLLLISNECSSLVAATPTATNLCLRVSASITFCIFFPSIVDFFSTSFPLSLSVCRSNRPPSFSHLSTFDNRDRRGETACSLARSLSRALAHPIAIRLAIVAHETSPIAKSNIRRCTAASTDDLVFPLHKRTKPYRTSRTNARTADTDPAVRITSAHSEALVCDY